MQSEQTIINQILRWDVWAIIESDWSELKAKYRKKGKNLISASDLLPEDEKTKMKTMCMQAADGDYWKAKELYESVKLSDLYETIALKNAINYRQNLADDTDK